MYLNSELKGSSTTVIIHVFLLMYGDVFLRIDKEEEGICVNWIGIADGGLVVEEGDRFFSEINIGIINDIIFNTDYPTTEEESQSLHWEIKCVDIHEKLIDGIDFGVWDNAVLNSIVINIVNVLNDESVTGCLTRILENGYCPE